MINRLNATLLTNYDESRSRLDLHNKCITDKDIPAILQFVNEHKICTLVMSKNWITDKGAALIVLNKYITTLNLALNRITDVGAQCLAKSSTIIKLDLFGNQLTNRGAEAFKKNIILQELDLNNNIDENEITYTEIQPESNDYYPDLVGTMFNKKHKEKEDNLSKNNCCFLQ
jgi:hypothetical protein